MSLKRMITKVALAFAAKKGVEMFNNVGGIAGMRDMLAPRDMASGTSRGGMAGRIGGTRTSSAGGLGNLLDSLGFAGATDGREAGVTGQAGSLGGILGSLAHAMRNSGDPHEVENLTRVGQEADAPLDHGTARAIIRAMVQTARADGHFDAEETQALLQLQDDADDSEREILRAALLEPVDAEAVARDAPSHAAMDIYAAALVIASPDNNKERAYVNKLGDALGLSPDARRRLEHAMFDPSPAV